MLDLYKKKVALDGKFAPLSKDEASLLVRSHSGCVTPTREADTLLCDDPDGEKGQLFRSANKQVITLADFGSPSDTWLARLKVRAAALGSGKEKNHLKNFAYGRPETEATLNEIATLIGFDLPADFLGLARSFSGLSFLYMRSAKDFELPTTELISWRFAHSEDPFWQKVGKATVCNISLPSWEEIFLTHAEMFRSKPPYELTLGKTVISPEDCEKRLFPFELYFPSKPTLLFADAKSKSFFVIHTRDYAAECDVSEPIPLWAYMEGLLDGQANPSSGTISPPGEFRYWRPLNKAFAKKLLRVV